MGAGASLLASSSSPAMSLETVASTDLANVAKEQKYDDAVVDFINKNDYTWDKLQESSAKVELEKALKNETDSVQEQVRNAFDRMKKETQGSYDGVGSLAWRAARAVASEVPLAETAMNAIETMYQMYKDEKNLKIEIENFFLFLKAVESTLTTAFKGGASKAEGLKASLKDICTELQSCEKMLRHCKDHSASIRQRLMYSRTDIGNLRTAKERLLEALKRANFDINVQMNETVERGFSEALARDEEMMKKLDLQSEKTDETHEKLDMVMKKFDQILRQEAPLLPLTMKGEEEEEEEEEKEKDFVFLVSQRLDDTGNKLNLDPDFEHCLKDESISAAVYGNTDTQYGDKSNFHPWNKDTKLKPVDMLAERNPVALHIGCHCDGNELHLPLREVNEPVDSASLAKIIGNYLVRVNSNSKGGSEEQAQKARLRCLIINACKGQEFAKAIEDQLKEEMNKSKSANGLQPFIITWTGMVQDPHCQAFCKGFYNNLMHQSESIEGLRPADFQAAYEEGKKQKEAVAYMAINEVAVRGTSASTEENVEVALMGGPFHENMSIKEWMEANELKPGKYAEFFEEYEIETVKDFQTFKTMEEFREEFDQVAKDTGLKVRSKRAVLNAVERHICLNAFWEFRAVDGMGHTEASSTATEMLHQSKQMTSAVC